MANYEPSKLLDGLANANETMLGAEWRRPNTIAFNVASQAEITNPSSVALREREDRQVKMKFPIRQATTGATSRVSEHTGAKGDSASTDITWTTIAETFSISIDQGLNNTLSYEAQFEASFKNAIMNLSERADTWFVAQLVADKTQIADDHGFGLFDETTTFNYEIELADEEFMFENVEAFLNGNDYVGGLTSIVDSRGGVLANKYIHQGSSNALNTAFQFEGWDNLATTNKEVLTGGYRATGIAFETGLVNVQSWIPVKNRVSLNAEDVGTVNGSFGKVYVEALGLDVAVSAYTKRSDESATNGSNQDLLQQWEVSIDLAYVSAPMSETNRTPVHAYGLKAS